MRNFKVDRDKFLEHVGNLGVAPIAAAIIGLFFQEEGVIVGIVVALAGAMLMLIGSIREEA